MAKYLNTDLIFKNRTEAGKQLAAKLLNLKLDNSVVIALPRGGVAVARPIADVLNVKLDIIVSKKIGAPNNPELAIGAVTSLGDYVISSFSQDIFSETLSKKETKWDYLQKQIVYLINDSREREKKYKQDSKRNILFTGSYKDMNVILVDDGTATGMTALAALKSIKKQEPKSITLAIPVISSQAYDEILSFSVNVVTLKVPRDFIAVGVHYEDFSPVTDEEIKTLL